MTENTLNIESLLEEFNLPAVHDDPATHVVAKIDDKPAEGSVEELTRKNVSRANRFLDILEKELIAGDVSAKMLESAAKLIDSVSTASEILSSIEMTEKTFDIKERSLDLRKYEFDAKLNAKLDKSDAPENLTQNMNFFVGSREDVMNLIKETTMKQQKPIQTIERTLCDDENGPQEFFDS